MAFPEAERDDAPRTSRFSENDSNGLKPEQFSLANEFNSPHLKNLLASQDSNADKQTGNTVSRTADVQAKGWQQELFSLRSHRSPWSQLQPGETKDSAKGNPAEFAKAKPGNYPVDSRDSKPVANAQTPEKPNSTADSTDTKAKVELPQFTLDSASRDKEKGENAKTEEPRASVSDLLSLLPSLSIDTDKIKNKTNELINDASAWLAEHLASPQETKEDSKISRDDEGNLITKLEDGRQVKEKKDGSRLEYDSKGQLSEITYKDGSNRKFKWEGDELVSMSSKSGEWTRARDENGKLKNEWSAKGQVGNWQGELKVDPKTGAFSSGTNTYGSDLSVEKRNSDGSKEISYPNKDTVKVDKNGLVSQINYADGSERKFTWSKNPDAKGEDDQYRLDTVQVKRDNNHYHHSRKEDGSWQARTWNPQTGSWSAGEAETNSFEFNNKTKEYSYTDSTDGIRHAYLPGGRQTDTSRDGSSLEYQNNQLTRAKLGENSREFEWKDGKLTAIHDGVQNKNWKPSADGGWESDKGDKRDGEAFISPSGEIGFKKGDKASIIKMDGAEFERITNDKEKSQVDIRKGEVQVTAADGSSRKFKTSDDGKEVLQESITRNGKTESWTRGERLANGNYTWTNDQDPSKKEERSSVDLKDGTLKVEYPDGRKYQANSNGSERLENEKANWYINYQNGQPSEAKYADGTVRKFKFDGAGTAPQSIEVTAKDGSVTKITRASEGVYDYKPPKGDATKWNVKFEVSRDGTYKFTDNDEKGKVVTRKPDGLMISENPADKSVIERRNDEISKITRDGKTTEIIRDDKNLVSELRDQSSNTTYKKNDKGEFVASAIDAGKPFNNDGLNRKGEPTIDESGLVKFTADDGTQIKQLPGQKGELISSKEKTLEAILNNTALSDQQKEKIQKNVLDYAARTDISGSDKAVFQASLAKFAARTDISDLEKARSYDQLNRLLESKSDKAFNAKDRALLAEQLAWHMGNPEANAQGENPNCQVTVIRGKLLYEKPSEFARMMTDVITTGQFVTKDGSTIKVPATSMRYAKGSEEATFPPADGTRTWMGKISDTTCANIHWQRQTVAPSGEVVQAGHLVYRNDPPSSRKDTGARVYKEPGDGYMYAQNDQAGKPITTPNLYAKDIADTYHQIAGGKKDEKVVVAVARQDIISGPGVALGTEEQLHKFLSENKGVHVAQIYTSTDWVWKEPARKYGMKPKDTTDGEHVVLVKDYDPVTRTVAVKNSWSSAYNHLAPDRRVPLHDLYKAMAKQN